jgi:hypothetical protein
MWLIFSRLLIPRVASLVENEALAADIRNNAMIFIHLGQILARHPSGCFRTWPMVDPLSRISYMLGPICLIFIERPPSARMAEASTFCSLTALHAGGDGRRADWIFGHT